jgi:hypothetical protein
MRSVKTVHSAFATSDSQLAALVGAAGAAVAITVATKRLAWQRERAAFGGAAIAFAASRATTGAARALFEGATLVGIGLGIAELVRLIGQPAEATLQHHPATPPSDKIRRADLERAIAEVQARNAAAASDRDDIRATLERDLQTIVREELGAAKARSAQAHTAVSERREQSLRTVESIVEAPPMDGEPSRVDEENENRIETHRHAVEVAPDAVEHLIAMNSLLEDSERQTLSTANATAPMDVVEARRDELLRRPPADAVDYLRRVELPAVSRRLSSSPKSSQGSMHPVAVRP